jgi:hypothetical protein
MVDESDWKIENQRDEIVEAMKKVINTLNKKFEEEDYDKYGPE